MKFSKDYAKLRHNEFTTIRKNTGYYKCGSIRWIKTPSKCFSAEIINIIHIQKKDITEEIAYKDADCSKAELIVMLEKWYGKEFDDFVLITLRSF